VGGLHVLVLQVGHANNELFQYLQGILSMYKVWQLTSMQS